MYVTHCAEHSNLGLLLATLVWNWNFFGKVETLYRFVLSQVGVKAGSSLGGGWSESFSLSSQNHGLC